MGKEPNFSTKRSNFTLTTNDKIDGLHMIDSQYVTFIEWLDFHFPFEQFADSSFTSYRRFRNMTNNTREKHTVM